MRNYLPYYRGAMVATLLEQCAHADHGFLYLGCFMTR